VFMTMDIYILYLYNVLLTEADITSSLTSSFSSTIGPLLSTFPLLKSGRKHNCLLTAESFTVFTCKISDSTLPYVCQIPPRHTVRRLKEIYLWRHAADLYVHGRHLGYECHHNNNLCRTAGSTHCLWSLVRLAPEPVWCHSMQTLLPPSKLSSYSLCYKRRAHIEVPPLLINL
jgi:hypothetical protein